MSEYALRTFGLTKKYSGKAIVNNIDMSIKKGSIYGLIGKNGAGKTTLMRMISGLAAPTQGRIEMFSGTSESELSQARRRSGCVIETPVFYLNLTAFENMEYRRRLLGIPDKSCIENILGAVRLPNTGKKKVKYFSLGMKQRLGIAIALLGNIDFLILDEPINGLDPKGIVEIRELLLKLNMEKNITILISSHILDELTKLATCYGVIDNGRLLREFTSEELESNSREYLKIVVNDIKKACFVLETVISARNFEILPDNTIRLYEFPGTPGTIAAELMKKDIIVEEIVTVRQGLEKYFMELVGGDENV